MKTKYLVDVISASHCLFQIQKKTIFHLLTCAHFQVAKSGRRARLAADQSSFEDAHYKRKTSNSASVGEVCDHLMIENELHVVISSTYINLNTICIVVLSHTWIKGWWWWGRLHEHTSDFAWFLLPSSRRQLYTIYSLRFISIGLLKWGPTLQLFCLRQAAHTMTPASHMR